jgi:hypothetical protein
MGTETGKRTGGKARDEVTGGRGEGGGRENGDRGERKEDR